MEKQSTEPDTLAKAALGNLRGIAVVGVLCEGKATYGIARSNAGNSPSESTNPKQPLFEIGSISKVFTGVLLAQAVESGDLGLDDTLGKLLKGKVSLSPFVSEITLRQLVTHSSSLPRMPADFETDSSPENPYSNYDRKKLWAALATLKLDSSPPGEAVYSNFGFAVIGELLSVRYNKAWDVLVRERITGPLGMTDTLQILGGKAPHLAESYSGDIPAPPWDMLAFAGAGGLRSTAADMLAFSRAILAGKEGPLGNAAERLLTPLGNLQYDEIGYAVMIRGPVDKRTFSHSGGTGGYRALWMVTPDNKQAVVILVSNAEAPIDRVELTIGASRYQVSSHPVPIDFNTLSEYAGTFRIDKSAAFTFVAQDGTLYGRLTGQPFNALTPTAKNTFAFPVVGAEFTFVKDGGKIDAVALNQGGRNLSASRTDEPIPAQAILPSVALSDYVGRYRETQQLGASEGFDVQSNAGQLAVKLNSQPRFPIFPVPNTLDRFVYDVVKAELQFERDASGNVVALILHQNGEHRAIKLEDSRAAESATI